MERQGVRAPLDRETMQYEFLRTESEYQAALKRLDQITGAAPGTEMGDELTALLDLIAAYEDDHFPED